MNVVQHFSASYQEAREKFLHAADRSYAAVESFQVPSIQGPSGENLITDVVTIGEPQCDRVLMIVSGTHGVEGYAGSGCQSHFLLSRLCSKIAESTRIVLVHAINPYGFAYNRRTNEGNIDLNRNFIDFRRPLPVNHKYLEHASKFLPTSGDLVSYHEADARLDAEARRTGGYEFLKKALQPGQYSFPEGLYYGGSKPSWSNLIFTHICRRHISEARRAAVLDIHTGLGTHGIGELIFMRMEAADQYAHHFTQPVSCAGDRNSVSAEVKGPLVNAANDLISGGEMAICCALEFGTVSVKDNTKAMILENWAHRYLSPDNPLFRNSSQRLKDTYYCDTPTWKGSVIERFSDVVFRLHKCLLAGQTHMPSERPSL